MRRRIARGLLLLAVLALGATAGLGHVRLRTAGGTFLRWANPGNVSIVIQADGSDDLSDASDDAALRLAIREWNEVSGTSALLVENTSSAERARTDWQSDGLHLLHFDELNATGYFGGNGVVAITPVWFQADGRIRDADVLFNGSDFSFTTSGETGSFDLQDVAAHELGHLLGLDHTGWAGGTMYPYVDPSMSLHRSLSDDELRGLRHAYPQGAFGTISGKVVRVGGDGVEGAHVVARSADGRTRSAILSAGDGRFTLRALEPGSYTVYAAPLDDPVGEPNLGGYTIEADFEPAQHGAPVVLDGTGNVAIGNLVVGDDVALHLGTLSDVLPVHAVRGTTTSVLLRGTGLAAGSTLEAADPDLLIGAPTWLGAQVSFLLTVPAGEPAGHVDLTVTNSAGERSILPAAIEITPPPPTVTGAVPGGGSTAGGSPVTISGTGFEPGARVVIGDQIYLAGPGGDATLVDPGTITLTTKPTAAGLHDVVVLDASGVEGRLADAFQATAVPAVTVVFPGGGEVAGGTRVTLSGANFQDGVSVRLNGVTQAGLVRESDERLAFTTSGGPAGPQVLEVENPDGGLATSAFSYAPAPDPVLAALAPASGARAGGDTLLLSGTDLPASAQVLFGADPATGQGGVAAAAVSFVDASTLEVVTPAGERPGAVSVLVRDPLTAQASVLADAFVYRAGHKSGGGCALRRLGPGSEGRAGDWAEAWWPTALVLVLLLARRRPACSGARAACCAPRS